MIGAWNDIMTRNFSPSWKNCLDKSMSKWLNEFTCPGFMFVPCKPWSFGNEWHDMDVQTPTSFGNWKFMREKINPRKFPKNMTTKVKQLAHSYDSLTQFTLLERLLCWIVVFACYRELLNCKRLVFMHML